MLVTASKFAAAKKSVRVKLLIDQKINGLSLKTGDFCDIDPVLARRLKNIGRVEEVAPDAGEAASVPSAPKVANR